MYQIVAKNFIISPYFRDKQLVINDKESSERENNIKKHIKASDYFGTLATIIDLTKQILELNTKKTSKQLKNLKDDLVYLQKNYTIKNK